MSVKSFFLKPKKKTSKFEAIAEYLYDITKPPKKKHATRNALIVAGSSALMLGVAGLINQKPNQS